MCEREKEAELALVATRAAREAAEAEEARAVNKRIAALVTYKDALLQDSTQPTGSQHTLHSRKRGRSRTPSRSPTSTAPSASRSPRPTERRRLTTGSGKDKNRRHTYSRSPSPEPRRRPARSPARNVPGLSFQQDERKMSSIRGRYVKL